MTDKNNGPTKLTDKQERFVQELLLGKSQREAYKCSYNAESMKDNTIDRRASELANNSVVKARLEELHSKLRNKLENECIVTVVDVVKELKKVAFANINDFLEYKTDMSVVGYEDGEPVNDYRTVVNLKESSTVDGTMINEVSISKDGTLKFKLHDKMVALDKIGRYLGMFTDKVEHSGEIKMPAILISK